jgi:hypothetical protein
LADLCEKDEVSVPWQDISYLLDGNERQRSAYRALRSLKIFRILHDYSPVLVGTIPIAIDIDESDLDIVCAAVDLHAFKQRLTAAFVQQEGFRTKNKSVMGMPSVVASFFHRGFRIEIFAQPRPVTEQNAYRHMLVEARLLAIGGEETRCEIRRLKRSGLKTEPAVAHYFEIDGDPYEVLLKLSWLSVDELRSRVKW